MLAAADEDLTLAKLVFPSSTTHAAKFAYLAALHSAMAALVFFNGDAPKTHSGVRNLFSKLAKDNEMLGGDLGRFLARAYDYKDAADYRFEAALPREDAEAAIESASDMLARIRKAMAK
jgi:uncharacterized protein (UPF0332 family)